MPASREWAFKGNTGRVEADAIWLTFRGTLDAEIARSLAEFMKAATQQGPLFFVADVENASPDAGFRKYIADAIPLDTFKGLVMLRPGVVQRVAQKAIALGAMLSSKFIPPMANFDTEAEARAWMDQQRRAPPPKPGSRAEGR